MSFGGSEISAQKALREALRARLAVEGEGLRFRVLGIGFRVCGLGFGALGFWVLGILFRVRV